MSLPENTLPNTAPPAQMLAPDSFPRPSKLEDYERGGIALQDPSQGLNFRDWTCDYVGDAVRVYPFGQPSQAQTLFSVADITELALSFDQNMRPLVAYMVGGDAFLWWFDPVPNDVVTLALAAGVRSPVLTMDDKRDFATLIGSNDVLLFYIRGTSLYYRQQRERFNIERELGTGIPAEVFIRRAGMNVQLRVQVELAGQDINDETTWTFSRNPALHAYHYARHRNGWAVPAEEVMSEEEVAQEADFCDIITDFTLRMPDNTTQVVTLPRYRSGLVTPTDADLRTAMDEILESMAGRDGWDGGVWRFRAGRAPNAVATMDASWLSNRIGEDGTPEETTSLEFVNGTPRDQRVNFVSGSCVDQTARHQVLQFPAIFDPVLIDRDGSIELELELQAVDHFAHAQHIGSILIRRAQAPLVINATCNLSAYPYTLFDVLTVNLPQYGIQDKTFEVVAHSWDSSAGKSLSLREIADGIYDPVEELEGIDPAPNTNLPDIRQVDQLTGLDADSEVDELSDGSIVTRLLVTWTQATQQSVLAGGRVEIHYADMGPDDIEDFELEWQIWEEDGAASSAVILGLLAGHFYALRARFVTSAPLRIRGPWSEQDVIYIAPLPDFSPGAPGQDGADALNLVLIATANQFHFDQFNEPDPPGQLIRFTALPLNYSETATFTVRRYDFDDDLIDDTVVLGGSGNTNRTLSPAQFGDAAYADIEAETTTVPRVAAARVVRMTDGSSARVLSLQLSATQFAFNPLGLPQPEDQVIRIDAFTLNYTDTVDFEILLYAEDGTLIDQTPLLGGSGNINRTLPVIQFADAWYADVIATTDNPPLEARARINRIEVPVSAAGVRAFSVGVFAGATGGDDADAACFLLPDGTIEIRRNNGSRTYRANWYDPTTADVGENFRIFATAVGDDLAFGSLGSYDLLDVERAFRLETGPFAFDTKQTTITIEVVGLSDTDVIATGTILLNVAKEP